MTDKLRSYGVAHRELMPDVIHVNYRYANTLSISTEEIDLFIARFRQSVGEVLGRTHEEPLLDQGLNEHHVAVN